MQVQENFSLTAYNTFGVAAQARYFARITSTEELRMVLSTGLVPLRAGSGSLLVLGGGSNILLTRDFDGLVIKNELKGIRKVSEDDIYVYLRAGAGENWHRFVLHCIENGWGGVENLSLIPGCVGASPMQNIGAYGVEIKDVFHELTAFHLKEKCNYTFTLKDCRFGYRESVFKNKYKDQFVILDVTFRLRKQPVFQTTYGAIAQELEAMGVQQLSISAVSQAVINIRSSKLPDPAKLGNAGSFFKNPSVDKEQFSVLKSRFPGIVGYENADGSIKLAAGWLIEHCGPEAGLSWKGYRTGDAGVHTKQALVLVNYGSATGHDLYALSEQVIQSVAGTFGVKLEREVNIL